MASTKRLGSLDLRALLQTQAAQEVYMGQPRELTCWSRTSIREGMEYMFKDRAGLHPFVGLPVPGQANLMDGFPEAFVRKPSNEPTGVESIVRAVQQAKVSLDSYNFVTYRNNLNKIFTTPLQSANDWTVDACCIHNTVYLDIVRGAQDNKTFADAEKFEYFGYKFESLCTAQPDVDATSEFASVLHVHLGDHRLIMAAEIDCYDPCYSDGDDPVGSYVEVKTHRAPRSARASSTLYGLKYPRWWVQSWLAGVRRIAGSLVSTRLVETASLSREAREAGCPWKPFHLLTLGNHVLGFIRRMGQEHPEQHLRFCYQGGGVQAVECSVIEGGTLPLRIHEALR